MTLRGCQYPYHSLQMDGGEDELVDRVSQPPPGGRECAPQCAACSAVQLKVARVLIKRQGNAEPEIAVVIVGFEPGAARRTEGGSVIPRAPANAAGARRIYPFAVYPGASIGRSALVAVVVDVLHPLPNVAMHVMEAPGIRRIRAHLGGLPELAFRSLWARIKS